MCFGCPICFCFVCCLGYPEYELVAGGSDLLVTSANLGQWIAGVVDATIGRGVERQLAAFRAGFNEVSNASYQCLHALGSNDVSNEGVPINV
jgi:E3 ubiquitin-protein ligase TRIP12